MIAIGNLGQEIIVGVGEEADTRDRPSEFAERHTIPEPVRKQGALALF